MPRPSRGGRVGRLLFRAATGAILVTAFLVGGVAFRVWQVARISDTRPADAILVLGAAQYDGTPSPVFRARLEQARDLYRGGVAPLVLTVGGKQPGDTYTEAESGRLFLVSAGLPQDAVHAVTEGSDTLRSIDAVQEWMARRNLRSVVIVSDPTHSLRARRMAGDAGLDARTAPVRHGPAVWTRENQLRGIIRETGALIFYELGRSPAHFDHLARGTVNPDDAPTAVAAPPEAPR